jgi:Zn-dependent peptidase ImmA (M78 family)
LRTQKASLRHARYLIAVVDHGNFTRAASALHVSQPALSQQIRQIEAIEFDAVWDADVNNSAIITIGEHSTPRRRRFSLAHEIGHWTHQTLVCRIEESRPQDKMSPERVANIFAADLLMPRYLFAPVARS